jgi:hypothetical protein
VIHFNSQERHSVQLFDVDREHWEEVGIGSGEPPAEALAYEVGTAKWVTTEHELDAIGHHGAGTLRYTARGLAVLRKEGYEG